MSNRSGQQLNKKVLLPLIQKYKEKRAQLKATLIDQSKSLQERFNAQLELQKLPRRSCASRLRRRCAATYRTRAHFRITGLNGFVMRQLINQGRAPGFKKASW